MLLDTHVALWLLDDSADLGPRTREALLAAPALHVSAASLWEIAIKSGLGKLAVPDDLPARVEQAGLQWLPVHPGHVWSSRSLSGLPHRDPFDRLLCAQALEERLPLVTADRALLGAELGPDVRRVDARA